MYIKISKLFFKIKIPIFIIILFLLTGCFDGVQRETSELIRFTCRSSVNIVMGDYCIMQSENTLKVLIQNRHLEEVHGIDVELLDRLGATRSKSFSSSLDIDEQRIFDISLSGHTPIEEVEITPKFLTSRGIEFCRPETLIIDEVRACQETNDDEI